MLSQPEIIGSVRTDLILHRLIKQEASDDRVGWTVIVNLHSISALRQGHKIDCGEEGKVR
jgi:hypothetical protein